MKTHTGPHIPTEKDACLELEIDLEKWTDQSKYTTTDGLNKYPMAQEC